MVGFVGGGVALALLLREVLNYPIVSEAVYWVGILGFLAVWLGSSQTLFDERDRALERRASQLTLTILAPILVVSASVTRLLPKVSDYAVPAEIVHALYGLVAVYVVFGVAYVVVRSHS
ncbi:DUF2178 domain-containing protein [Halorussus sp. MSC15.2]|uniref:DUF2178 domain-containing protein n=1 Tax=Halorussus sp. MSC15.2 TaxID=2283638 RepID=UPI0013D219C2|nr:DUF2178 domain-containing protein [Halorussus sp. MSC15.2]NEU55825.1 DUF2178 domain-containing protein [Halorussus sp. MSC15.2]